jgi:hypothetical protein
VIPGHPFFTEHLDRQRAEQRLILAGMPERVLEAAGIPGAETVPPEATGRVETILRRLAGSLIRAIPTKVLQDLSVPVEKRVLLAWARDVDSSQWPNQVVEMVSEEAHTSPDDEGIVDQLITRHDKALIPLAALLVWADDLAGDYADPRIKARRERFA